MRIGILTFHNAINYGAVLQTYATQQLLLSMGHEVEVIDYHNYAIDEDYKRLDFSFKLMPKKKMWNIPKYIISTYLFKKKREIFNSFLQSHIILSKKRYNQSLIPPIFKGYDAIFIGSDQLWNKSLTGGFDDVYWGNFKRDNKCKVIAWSICMNKIFDDLESETYIKNNISNFNYISVRENDLKKYLQKISLKPVSLTLDPTFVVDSSVWSNLCVSVNNKDYILVYSVVSIPETEKVARRLAKKTGLKIIYINPGIVGIKYKNHKKTAGIIEFISYIKNARYVVTSSFHGVAFSVIFKKQFFCVVDPYKGNARVSSLLFNLDLSNRIVTFDECFDEMSICNYSDIDNKIVNMRKESINFINIILNDYEKA